MDLFGNGLGGLPPAAQQQLAFLSAAAGSASMAGGGNLDFGQPPQQQQQQAAPTNIHDVLHTFVRAQMNKWNTRLMMYCELYQWRMVLIRLGTHPHEVAQRAQHNGKTPLHVACASHAAKIIVHSLSSACPQAVRLTDRNGMTPVHVACSSRNACADSIRCLLRWATPEDLLLQDLDGDTPTHVACRVGAPAEVLQLLIDANPQVLFVKDREQLTPLHRLWVRHYVRLNVPSMRPNGMYDAAGGDAASAAANPGSASNNNGALGASSLFNQESLPTSTSQMTPAMAETWAKTVTILKALSQGAGPRAPLGHDSSPMPAAATNNSFSVLHAAVAYDCPRDVVPLAMSLHPELLLQVDQSGRRPASVAAMAPVYQVRDLTLHGYSHMSNAFGGGLGSRQGGPRTDVDMHATMRLDGTVSKVPSVLQMVAEKEPAVSQELLVGPHFDGPLLHLALRHGKGWEDGVSTIVKSNPDAVSTASDAARGHMYPFMLAAIHCATPSPAHHLTTIFELLKLRPELVEHYRQHATTEASVPKASSKRSQERRGSTMSRSDEKEDGTSGTKKLKV